MNNYAFYSPSCLCQRTTEGYFSLLVKLPPVYHTWWRLRIAPFDAEYQAKKAVNINFFVFGLSQPGTEPEFNFSVAEVYPPDH